MNKDGENLYIFSDKLNLLQLTAHPWQKEVWDN